MIPRRARGALGAIAAVVVIVGPAAEGRAALTYDFSLGAGAMLNDNLHLDPRAGEGGRQPVQETIITLDPGATVAWHSENDRLQLLYAGQYSQFSGDEERDSLWIHNLAADLIWRRWSPFFLEAREERSRVPRTQDGEIEAIVDQVDRNRLSVRAGLVSELGPRSAVELGYRGELESYSGAEGPFDQVQRHTGEVLVRHRWSPLWGGEASATYGEVDRELAPDATELTVSAAVNQRWNERTTLRYGLQWVRSEEDAPGGDGLSTVRNNLLKSLEIIGELEGDGSWSLAYQDGLAEQPDGDTLKTGRTTAAASVRSRLGSTLNAGGWYETRDFRESGREETAWGPTLGVRWRIAPWAALDLGGSWTSTTSRPEGQVEIEDHATRAAGALVLLLFRRVQLETGYRYGENDSTDALRSHTNNIIYAQATFHFRPVPPNELPDSGASGW